MKLSTKKHFLRKVSAVLLVLFFIVPTIAFAAPYTELDAYVVKFGMNNRFSDNPVVYLDDPTDTIWTGARLFFLDTAIAKEGLATVISAISFDRSVWVRISDNAGGGQIIQRIYLNEEGKDIDPPS